LDIEGAYRTIPIKPIHKKYLVLHFYDEYLIDHNAPFGAGSSHGLQGEVGDTIIDILYALRIHPAIKWVDDYSIFRFPSPCGTYLSDQFPSLRYDYDLSLVKLLIEPLGIPWHREKGQDFDSVFPYMGFQWDLSNKTVSIPEKKRVKHLSRLSAFSTKCQEHCVVKKDVETINGSLAHLSFVLQRGRSHLPSLFHWLSTFPNEFTPRWPPPSVLSDIAWWTTALEDPNAYHQLSPSSDPKDIGIWIDASTGWGIGVLIDGRWDAWRLVDSWDIDGRDIMWLEAIAVEFLFGILAALGHCDTRFLVRSDNTGVIGP
jgi:hypothetical protein